jgi:hypothetical protein
MFDAVFIQSLINCSDEPMFVDPVVLIYRCQLPFVPTSGMGFRVFGWELDKISVRFCVEQQLIVVDAGELIEGDDDFALDIEQLLKNGWTETDQEDIWQWL